MLTKFITFMKNNLNLCFVLDLLIITGVGYIFDINPIAMIIVLGVYFYFVVRHFESCLKKKPVDN